MRYEKKVDEICVSCKMCAAFFIKKEDEEEIVYLLSSQLTINEQKSIILMQTFLFQKQ